MCPVHVEQMVMTSSRPSASACAYVRALSTRAMSRLVSLTTDAPQHDAAVSSISSMPSLSASSIVELKSSLHDSFATQPGKNPYRLLSELFERRCRFFGCSSGRSVVLILTGTPSETPRAPAKPGPPNACAGDLRVAHSSPRGLRL